MNLFLTSKLKTVIKDENGIRYSIPLDNENQILDNIKRCLSRTKRIVNISNNPQNFENNDMYAKLTFESFEKTGFNFSEKIVLDDRNKKNAESILKNADIIILSGGKISCQNEFFNEIKLKKILRDYKGVVIGVSAGTMNLCKKVFNFPEELIELDEQRWFEGLGFYDESIIPHFDGDTKSYQTKCEEIDIVNDFILPASRECDFVGLKNGAYILIEDDGKITLYGDIYKISDGQVRIINNSINEQSL